MTYRQMVFEMHRILQAAGGQVPFPRPSLPLCIQYLNQALQYANEITDYLLQRQTFTNVNTPVHETEFTDIYQVWWGNNRLYRQLETTTQTGNLGAGVPSTYIARGGRIALFPAPASAGTLTVLGIAKHPIVTDSDVSAGTAASPLPEWVRQAIVYLAAGYYLMAFPEQIERANLYIQRATEAFTILRQRVSQQRMYELAPANTLQGYVYQIAHPHLQTLSIDQIESMIQQAFIHYFGFINSLVGHVNVTVPANTDYVELNAHRVVEVYRVFLTDEMELLHSWDGNWDLLLNRDETGRPRQYVAYGNRIELFPRPSQPYELRIEGALIPTSNELSYIPPHLHFSIAEYAAGLLLMSIYTEKGASIGAMHRGNAMQQWMEWRRQQVANSYATNEATHAAIHYANTMLHMED